jgi:hypothetical protein
MAVPRLEEEIWSLVYTLPKPVTVTIKVTVT